MAPWWLNKEILHMFCLDCDSTLQYLSNKLLNTSIACHMAKLALAHVPPGGHIGFCALTRLAPGVFLGILCFHILGVIRHHSWKIQLSAFFFWVVPYNSQYCSCGIYIMPWLEFNEYPKICSRNVLV